LFRRINLAEVNCRQLRFTTELKLSPSLTDRILRDSRADEKGTIALYGTVYSARKVPHVAQAIVRRRRNVCRIELRYLAEEWPKPPNDVKSVKELAIALSEEPQEAKFDCDVYFTYNERSGWKSILELPVALPKKGNEDLPFTHIEAIRVSKREHGKIQYAVQVRQTKTGNLRHWVYFTEKGPVSSNTITKLLKQSVNISKSLLEKQEEE